jgi:hypothetical protein
MRGRTAINQICQREIMQFPHIPFVRSPLLSANHSSSWQVRASLAKLDKLGGLLE